MNIESYLRRINYHDSVEPSPSTLQSLHLAHMYAVPFENLDIHQETPIVLDLELLYKKIVINNRGGFCYELNGLFGWLLQELGFEVEMLSARVYGRDGVLGPEFDHMLLRVNHDYLADVGFGDSFTEPLRFDKSEQVQPTGTYCLIEKDGSWQLERDRGEGPKPQYVFTDNPRELSEFAAICHFQQTSPESMFTQKTICSMANPAGRVTISDGRLIETENGEVSERAVDDLRATLRERFGVEIVWEIDGEMDN